MPQITNLTRQLIADLSIALLLAMLGADAGCAGCLRGVASCVKSTVFSAST